MTVSLASVLKPRRQVSALITTYSIVRLYEITPSHEVSAFLGARPKTGCERGGQDEARATHLGSDWTASRRLYQAPNLNLPYVS